jgi:hypothetical protein
MHDDSPLRARTQRLAYQLWQEAGCPEGQSDRFWREAEGVIAAAPALAAAESPAERDPPPAAVEPGWRAGLARYFAAWWAHPSKPGAR